MSAAPGPIRILLSMIIEHSRGRRAGGWQADMSIVAEASNAICLVLIGLVRF
jgi:hypothetical protein